MSRTMATAQSVFQKIQDDPQLRCVVVRAMSTLRRGDIFPEYAAFRFQEESLRAFHEDDVWGGLQSHAGLRCAHRCADLWQLPGAGVEIASCCDVRIAADDARFGAPIAKLGFSDGAAGGRLVRTRWANSRRARCC